MNRLALILAILCSQFCYADNGHFIGTRQTDAYTVAIFVEPWPARIGELRLQCLITDKEGNLVRDHALLPLSSLDFIELNETGPYTLTFALDEVPLPPFTIEVLPKATVLQANWPIWTFLVFGLICILLRDKLARKMQERYPSL